MKILIIDDEELYITGLKELLTHIDENCEINACCDYNNIKNNIPFFIRFPITFYSN